MSIAGLNREGTEMQTVYLEQVQYTELGMCCSCCMPDGEYDGSWSGYTVVFVTPLGECKGRATVGVRGLNIPCKVTIEDGQFTVRAK